MRTLQRVVFTAITGFFASSISVAVAENLQIPGKRPDCKPNPKFTVVDFSLPTTSLKTNTKDNALKALKETFGIDTVFRYYDHKNETLPGKTLHAEESDAIIAAGMKIGVVFQHHNDDPAKFLQPEIGKEDAERALALADENRQPFDTAIYFGIDGPELHLNPLIEEYRRNNGKAMSEARQSQLRGQRKAYFVTSYENFHQYGPEAFKIANLDKVTPEMMGQIIERYFGKIKAAFEAYSQRNDGKSYRIGMYCTAAMCQLGADKNWAQYFWLSPEGRLRKEYPEFFKRIANLNLVQHLPTVCPGWGPTPDRQRLEFDFNQVNSSKPEFGQWGRKRSG